MVMIGVDVTIDKNKRDMEWTKKDMMTRWRWWVALTLQHIVIASITYKPKPRLLTFE